MSTIDQNTNGSVPPGLLEAVSSFARQLVSTVIAITRTQKVCTVTLESPQIFLGDAVLTIQVELRPKMPSDQMAEAALQGLSSVQLADASLLESLKKPPTR